MKTYGTVDALIDVFLTSTLVGGECSDLCPGSFISRGKSPRCPLDSRLGGPQKRSDRRGEERTLALTGI
jgi:hypothetical protein